jgi:salicylate hydroxylase
MSDNRLHVAIIGGGIGGLCLAQGLRKAGVSVALYERDRVRSERLQGYRLHISPRGSRALYDCLPSELYQTFVATAGASGGRFRFLDETMEELLGFEVEPGSDPIDRHHSVSRITLRQVLLAGLGDVVHFGKTFSQVDETPDGRMRLCFEDGSRAVCDLLVGADGGNSRVRKQFLPQAQRIDTGVVGIAGKLMLTEENRPKVPAALLHGSALVMARGRCTMFIAPHEFGSRARPAIGAIGGHDDAYSLALGPLFDNTTSYLMWAYGGRRGDIEEGGPLEAMNGDALIGLIQRLIARWHPDFQAMVRLSDPASTAVLPIRTSVPIAPWETKRVTLIGDAIHSMTPYRGIGANVALRDASTLCANLVGVRTGACELTQAVHDYEEAMRDYGFAAVRGSLEAMHTAIRAKGLGFRFAKLGFRALNRLPPLKRRFLATFAEERPAT